MSSVDDDEFTRELESAMEENDDFDDEDEFARELEMEIEDKEEVEVIEEFDDEALLDQAIEQNRKYCGQNIVFVESSISLNSVVYFSQHVFKHTRLLTLIGEIHHKTWECPSPSTTIAEYSKKCVMRNPKCKVMLEYYYQMDPERIDSHGIRTTFTALKNIGKTNAIIAYDPRVYFFGVQALKDLYFKGIDNYQTPEQIGQTFIEPYFQRLRENPTLFSLNGNYDPKIANYLMNSYVPDLTENFYTIAIMLQQNKPRNQIQLALMETWKKVTDFFVLRTILTNDNTDEYIIILGTKHHENLSLVLNNMTSKIVERSGSPQNCVNLFETCSFD